MGNDILEVLETQYSECWSDVRDHRTRMWQISASTIAVTSVFVGTVFSQVPKDSERGAFAAVVFLLDLMLYVQLRKERFFEEARTKTLEAIQKKLRCLGCEKVEPIEWRTRRIREQIEQGPQEADRPRGWFQRRRVWRWFERRSAWFERRSAYNWLHFTQLAILVGLLGVAVAFFVSALNLHFVA